MELSFDGEFELEEKDADILIQLSGGAVLWQKERLLKSCDQGSAFRRQKDRMVRL